MSEWTEITVSSRLDAERVRKAFADGAEMEMRAPGGEWDSVTCGGGVLGWGYKWRYGEESTHDD